ncbi:MAG: GNAT family N-acetyltransferase [Reyranella sp.]|uniref:GNAT family N-acetyltransferase n=1 Tax=Reyranella sp. TaxID=1929291 RepID=UPI0025EDDDB2|nr:GNAT family N-acetyltransferase [Reyranella sp.]MBR2817804.1 GNAT family N-acetyltransferase [Reyranella sp.]
MIVRDLQPADLAAAAVLLGQLGYPLSETELRERLDRVTAAPDHAVRVAESEGVIVGLIHMFERPALEKPREAVVQSLVVDGRHRGTGIGVLLMRDAEAWARSRRLASVTLYTRIDRDAARAFYERLGYQRSATSHQMRCDL